MAQELIMAVLTPAWSLRGTMPAASSSPVDPCVLPPVRYRGWSGRGPGHSSRWV